jgi:trans-2,3-dihydro-3-hydroxyanthranilate isomerase
MRLKPHETAGRMTPVQVPFRLVDVFADRPLSGNQLCVVPSPVEGLTEQTMQAVACEIGFSETTFVQDAGADRYFMRIFTPTLELPFAGHPTLGTAYVLANEGRIDSSAVQVVAGGEFPVTVDLSEGFARMQQLPPRFGPVLTDRSAVAEAVGLDAADLHSDLQPQVVSTGLPHLVVAVSGSEAVVAARPDESGLLALLDQTGAGGYYVFALEGDRAKARMFAAGVGVDEDPATGSAAGPLGAYLADRGALASGRLTISQGAEIGRPSTLVVEVERDGPTWRITVGGGVFVVGRGWFELELR